MKNISRGFVFLEKIMYISENNNNIKILKIMNLTEQKFNEEWTKFYGLFDECGLTQYYDMEQLKQEMAVAPCAMNENMGTAYGGALLIHILMLCGMAERMSHMISGTFKIDSTSLIKVCLIMHLSKRFLYVPSKEEWEIKKGIRYKFAKLDGCLKGGERSALEALNNGVKLTEIEYEAIKCLDDDDDASKHNFQSIITTIVRLSNELAYSVEKERYNKEING